MLNTLHSSRRNNGNKRPKVLCGPSALFSEGKVASTHHFCQSHTGPKKPLGLTSIITTLNPKFSYFSSCGRGWKAKFKSLFFLSRRPISPVSKNQEHDFLLAGEVTDMSEPQARAWDSLSNINDWILNCYYSQNFIIKWSSWKMLNRCPRAMLRITNMSPKTSLTLRVHPWFHLFIQHW